MGDGKSQSERAGLAAGVAAAKGSPLNSDQLENVPETKVWRQLDLYDLQKYILE